MTHADQVSDVIGFFQKAFTVVLALALGEAFKQFVTDKSEDPSKFIGWSRFPALISFTFFIFPFFQGMSRYFFATYGDVSHLPVPYEIYLLSDSALFMIEAIIFFIMSRALSLNLWRQYYSLTAILCAVDATWGFLSVSRHNTEVLYWAYVDVGYFTAVLGFLCLTRNGRPWIGASIGLALVIIRTSVDYYCGWNYYFPSVT